MGPIASLAAFLPTRWQPFVPLAVLAVVVTCKIVTVLIPPPAASSRWLPLYTLVNKVALNLGWAVNAYQASKTPILVPCEHGSDVRTAVAERLNIPRDETKP